MKNKKFKLSRQKPLRSFSWTKNLAKTKEQELIEETVVEWYDAKHRSFSAKEIQFINSIKVKACPLCGSERFHKDGKRKDGVRRYRCNDCEKIFNPLTNTIFDSRKIPISEWIEYLLHLFEFHSITSSAFDNRNANSTGRYWLKKVFEVLKGCQDNVVLSGIVYVDETFFGVMPKDEIKKDNKKLRGISRNKICVCTAIESRSCKSIVIATNTSKPSARSTLAAYGPHIGKGSTMIHDDENSHQALIDGLDLKSIVYKAKDYKGVDDKDNPMDPINEYHSLLKRFMREHGGYDRDNLQDWMNLFWYITNGPKDRYDKVLKFIGMAISSQKRMKFRDVMIKKPRD